LIIGVLNLRNILAKIFLCMALVLVAMSPAFAADPPANPPTIKTFDSSMISSCLGELLGKFRSNETQTSFEADFAPSELKGGPLKVVCQIMGDQKNFFIIAIMSDKVIEEKNLGLALALCNTWNKDRFGPKVYVEPADENGKSGKFVMRDDFNLRAGIHQELFNDLTASTISYAYNFWTWAYDQMQ
jgi:hypothetical protein